MKNVQLLCLLALLIANVAKAQDTNPFKSIGKKGKIITLSRGRYQEVFDTDTIQRIGSVLYNTRTKKIVKLLDEKKVYEKYSDNTSSSRWYSVDPLAEKFAQYSPYNFCVNNPINLVDPDGAAAEWVPTIQETKDKKGNVTAAQLGVQMEKGDNAKSLAAFLGVSQKAADKLFNSKDKDGNITLTDNVPGVTQINEAISDYIKNPDDYGGSVFTENYNCWESAIKISQQETPNFGRIMEGETFDGKLSNGYSNISDNPGQLKFGKTVVRFGYATFFGLGSEETSHGAVYLGTSKNGTKWTWSKNGTGVKPGIFSVKALEAKYDPVRGLNGEKGKGYFNQN